MSMNRNQSLNRKHSFTHPAGNLWLFVLIFLLMCPFGCKALQTIIKNGGIVFTGYRQDRFDILWN